jgi:hypothetical protein
VPALSTPKQVHGQVATELKRWNKIIDIAKIDRQ